jgi:hypothetical protein
MRLTTTHAHQSSAAELRARTKQLVAGYERTREDTKAFNVLGEMGKNGYKTTRPEIEDARRSSTTMQSMRSTLEKNQSRTR